MSGDDMEKGPLVEFSNVSKLYDGRTLFEDFSLTVEQNEVVGLTGESGSGKSTLLRIAVDLASPDSGHVSAMGKRVGEWDPRDLRRNLVLVPQQAEMFPGTVRENLLWGLKLYHETKDDHELTETLNEVNLPGDKLDKLALNLSGGEKQRVAIARALLLEPKALLLDEPTSALDEKSARSVEETITALINERSIGVLMVTHNENQARRFTSRIVRIGGSN